MPELTITIGGHAFQVACQAGEEGFLRSAAALLDAEAQPLVQGMGPLPEVRMLLMAGLMLADKTAALEDEVNALRATLAEIGDRPAPPPQIIEVPVEVPVEVRVEVPVEVRVEVPVEVRVPVEVLVEVPVEVRVEVPVEVPVEIEVEVPFIPPQLGLSMAEFADTAEALARRLEALAPARAG